MNLKMITGNFQNDSDDETEMSYYCVTCGQELPHKVVVKHMEKCFNKVLQIVQFSLLHEYIHGLDVCRHWLRHVIENGYMHFSFMCYFFNSTGA